MSETDEIDPDNLSEEEAAALVVVVLRRGMDPNLEEEDGKTLLENTYRAGSRQVTRVLLLGGADPTPLGWNALHAAVLADKPKVVKRLATKKRQFIPSRDLDGLTPFLLAVALGEVENAKILFPLTRPEDRNPVGDQAPPVLLASRCGHLGMVQWLLAAAFDPVKRMLRVIQPWPSPSKTGPMKSPRCCRSMRPNDFGKSERYSAIKDAIIVPLKSIASILLFLAVANQAIAAIDRDDPANYGIGVLTCPYDKYGFTANCFVDLTWLPGPVTLYEGPSRLTAVTGTILHPRSGDRGWQAFNFRTAAGAWGQLESVEVGYEENTIVVFERQGDWLRTGQGWLFAKDLKIRKQTVYADWGTALRNQLGEVRDEDGFIGWFYPMTNQPLYTAPDGDEIGVFWDSAAWEASLLVLEQRGGWIQVLIDTTGYPCAGDGLKPGGQTGWIRLTNDAGHPEIFWYTRGC